MTRSPLVQRSITFLQIKIMNKLLYFAFLSCVAFTSCDKPPKLEGDKENTKKDIEAGEKALRPKARLELQLQADSEGADQRDQGENIAPREDQGRAANVDYRSAEPKNSHFKKIKKLTAEEIKEINANIRSNPVVSPNPEVIVATAAEAFKRVNVSLSMATVPEVFAEDGEHYYFSGGLSVDRVNNFSSGVRISKIGGAIHVWPSQP